MQHNEALEQLSVAADRLANAAETLDRALARLDAQHETLNAKVDHIVAAIEDRALEITGGNSHELERRVAELEKANADLKAQAARLSRKTLSPFVSGLLAKSGAELNEKFEASALDKTLQSLSVEQRIAVKAEMARAGMID